MEFKRFSSTQILQGSFKIDLITNSFWILFNNLRLRQRYWLLFQRIILLYFSLFQKKKKASLTKYENYVIEIKKLSRSFCTKNDFLFNCHLKRELLKYEVLPIWYTKHVAKEIRPQKTNLDYQSKNAEKVCRRLIT